MAFEQIQDPETEIFTKSKINSAGLMNLRMHQLWQDVNKHARRGQYALWNADLDRIWCELAGDVNEKSEDWETFKELKRELMKVSPILNWKPSEGFQELTFKQLQIQNQQYEKLIDKEVFLRRLQNKQGKGTAYVDEQDDWE